MGWAFPRGLELWLLVNQAHPFKTGVMRWPPRARVTSFTIFSRVRGGHLGWLGVFCAGWDYVSLLRESVQKRGCEVAPQNTNESLYEFHSDSGGHLGWLGVSARAWVVFARELGESVQK